MLKGKKLFILAGAAVAGYYLWKYYSKPQSVLIKGSDADTPEKVEYSTGKEGMLGSDGTLDTMINLKKPIYIRPQNSIPNVYDRGIGQFVNCSGGNYMNAMGFHENLATACNAQTVKQLGARNIDMPIVPQN